MAAPNAEQLQVAERLAASRPTNWPQGAHGYVRSIAQAIADAVEEFRVSGAYCLDCGNPMDDWRGHGNECFYRDEDEEV